MRGRRGRAAVGIGLVLVALVAGCSDDEGDAGGRTDTTESSEATPTTTPGSTAAPAPRGTATWNLADRMPRLNGDPFSDGVLEVFVAHDQAKLLPANTFKPGAPPRAGKVLVVPVVLVDSRADDQGAFTTRILFNAKGRFTGEDDDACLLDGYPPGALVDVPATGDAGGGRRYAVFLTATDCLTAGPVDSYEMVALTMEARKAWNLSGS